MMFKRWVIAVMLCAFSFSSAQVWAQKKKSRRKAKKKAEKVEKGPLPIGAWIEDWRKREVEESRTGSAIRKVVFVQKLVPGKLPKLIGLDAKVFNNISYLSTSDRMDLKWGFRLNAARLKSMRDKNATVEEAMIDTFSVSGADSLALYRNKQWHFYELADGEPSIVNKVKAKRLKSEEEYHRWLSEVMGFDAIALERRGNKVLVLAPANRLKDQIQALAYRDSTDKAFLTKKKGQALLQLEEADGNYGVFSIVTTGKSEAKIAYGTKILLQKQ